MEAASIILLLALSWRNVQVSEYSFSKGSDVVQCNMVDYYLIYLELRVSKFYKLQ